MRQTELTEKQKLAVLGFNFYQQPSGGWSLNSWEPKAGDYYTTSRADLQLYQIVREDDEYFYTKYCGWECTEAQWKKTDFKAAFGINRVQVQDWVFDIK